VNTAVLSAAHELFSERGYGVTAKDIAERAGVHESVIFTKFGSKAELFQATLASSFLRFIDDYVEMWEREPEGGQIPELIARYVRGLYGVAYDNRLILQALMAGPRSGDPALGQVAVRTQRHFANALARIHRVITIAGGAHGYPLDPPATAAVTAGMIIAAAVHQDWLLPDSSRELDNERLITELTTMLLYGTTRREPAP
jgi:AcrR family transcriptional regulator